MRNPALPRLVAVALSVPLALALSVAPGESSPAPPGEVAAQERGAQRRSADELRGFRTPGGAQGVALEGWADHTVFVRRGAEGEPELVCLQGDTHELAARLLAPGSEFLSGAAAPASTPSHSSRFANVGVTMQLDPDLPAGADERDRVLLYTPDPVQRGSSRSHFDTRASPNLLMEPGISADLEFGEVDLTNEALRDMGWPNGRFTPVIDYADAAGAGFNDASLGQARRDALEFVVGLWRRLLGSRVDVNIQARFTEQSCTQGEGAVLASAGPTFVFRDFRRGKPGVWYAGAMAEAMAREDLSGAEDPGANPADLVLFFNSALDNECLGSGSRYYYGLDGNTPSGQFSFVAVALHEMAHGLGFTGFSDLETGQLFLGNPDIFTSLMYDNEEGESWADMTRRERRKSAVNDGDVVFTGKKTRRGSRKLLDGTTVLRITSPAELAGTYEVGISTFAPALDEVGLSGDLALTNDGSATPTLACQTLTNAGELAGRIAVIDRGSCRFDEKAKRAQDAGAVGVVVINNVEGPAVQMGGEPAAGVTIPVVMVDMELGAAIKADLGS